MLAGDKLIAEMTANIPHPYLDGMAEQWIGRHATWYIKREAAAWAITLRTSGKLVGTVSITQILQNKGNLGYWIGVPYWGNGYCTEAVKEIINFAFASDYLDQIYARHLPENNTSGKVIQKSGFCYIRDVAVGDRELLHYELNKSEWKNANR